MTRISFEQIIVAAVLIGLAIGIYRQWQQAPLRARGAPPTPASPATARSGKASGRNAERPQTIARAYKGSAQRAAWAFQADSVALAKSGYVPVSQIYTPGSWGCGAFLVALLLFVVLIGILVFIYMLIVKPDGVLVVTYEYRPAALAARPAATDPTDALSRLTDLRDRGVVTAEEYAAKRAEILARL